MNKAAQKLRKYIRQYTSPPSSENDLLRLLAAALKEKGERCAAKCDAQAAFYRSLKEKGDGGLMDADIARAIAAEDCAAAIRGPDGR